ncbi:MAG TPA: RHS repeat-associated core domain-containing protein [Cellvibrio sp.]|nr:RHS repeat-associated core domain-containing protein [Cellvibrio sp.]
MKYTSYDLPSEIIKGSHKTEFSYGPSRARYKRVDTSGSQISTTLYLGSVEKVYYWDGTIQWKRNIAGVAQITQTVNSSGAKLSEAQRYFIKDHLGSIGMITDEIGYPEQTNFFDPWGRERKIITSGSIKQWLANNDNYRIANKPITTRGFTGHEQLAEVGLIHMNGRIYDGALGRFVQADPIIQDPLRVQSLNRYSYVWNNPLNATDPSGFMCDKGTNGIGCESAEREAIDDVENVDVIGKKEDRRQPVVTLTFVSGTVSGNSFSGYALRGQGYTAFVSEDIVNKYTGGDLKNITQKILNKIVAGAAAKNSLAVVSAAAEETDVSMGDVLSAIAPFFIDPNQMMGDMLSDAAGGISATSISTSQAAISSAKIEAKIAGAGNTDKVTLALLSGAAALATFKKIPNPDGKKGGARHQAHVEDEVINMQRRYGENAVIRTEVFVKGADGKVRFLDAQAIDRKTGVILDQVQVGKTNKNGTPVIRERRAMEDIDRATGFDTRYRGYDL